MYHDVYRSHSKYRQEEIKRDFHAANSVKVKWTMSAQVISFIKRFLVKEETCCSTEKKCCTI